MPSGKNADLEYLTANSRSLTDLYQDPMLPVRLLSEILIDTLQLKLVAYTLDAIILFSIKI